MDEKNIDLIISKLESFIFESDLKGFDPYDIKGTKYFLNLLSNKNINLWKKIKRKILLFLIDIFPITSRKIFNVEKKINFKALGLIITSYVNLYTITNNQNYLSKATKISNILLDNYNKNYSGKSWGYPFDWQSKIFIPKYTPSSVVSYHVGEGFYNLYKATNNEKYLNVCKDVCDFYLNDLNTKKFTNNTICFSYTPLDNYMVNNANLFVASFLIKIGHELNNKEYINYGIKAARFSKNQQNKDGSLFYWAKESENFKGHMDHYHTGFEIRMFYDISKYFPEFRKVWKSYYKFYRENFFEDEKVKINKENIYNIDIHGCAEAILCNSYIDEKFNEKFVEKIIYWVNKNMFYKNQYYIYKIIDFYGLKYKVKIPYIRWGQAWMLRALTEFKLSYYIKNNKKD